MTPDRFQQIERLFHEAADRAPDARDSFLESACGGDEELRGEIESLLFSDSKAAHFIEVPPAEIAAQLLTREMTDPLLGQTLAHYQIVSKLGTGGMGEVYLAQDKKLGRNVAMKLLPPPSMADVQAIRRLINEAQAAAKLDHPNICAIYEVGEHDGHNFIVMQLVEGETLDQRIGKKALETREVLEIAVQITDALAFAHSRGITHRDIKPQNIMVTSSEHAKVMDFGLARIEEHHEIGCESETMSFVTEPDAIAGTIPYMSPEQVKGESLDSRSDIFSLGTVLYEITTRENPFAEASAAETISAILTKEPPPLSRYAEAAPEELRRIIGKCLEKDKSYRYQSTSDLLSDLRRLKFSVDSGIKLPVIKRKNQSRLIFACVGVVVIVLGIIVSFLFWRNRVPADNAINSLAILPFVNANKDPDSQYLSDGITENLINTLSQLSQLKVIARTTAFRYKDKDQDPRALGRDLNVNAVITGRVIHQSDNLIVQVDLLSAIDGTQLWGAKYSRKLSDVFAVQELIAREISANLRLKLTGKETQALSRRYTQNIKAYQDYSIGLTYLNRRTLDDFLSAINYFGKAIDEEPGYALAHAALTEAYVSATIRGLIDPAEGRRKVEDSARMAFSLDPNLPESHVAIAESYLFFPPYNFPAGDREVQTAMELNPGLASAYQVSGASLLEQGRLDEALRIWSKAREIDPLSPIIARLEAFTWLEKRDYPRAYRLLQQSAELGPPFIIGGEVEMYIENGKISEVVAELEKAKLQRKDDPIVIYSDGLVAATKGPRQRALELIKELERLSGPSLHRAMWIAMICSSLNEKEMALDWLERGLQANAITIFYKDAPVWDAIRGETRFREFLRRMAIPH